MKVIERPSRKGFNQRVYLLEIVRGMAVTMRHVLANLWNYHRMPVLYYPEQKKIMPPGYRGKHRLIKREDGAPKCVACMMCATACPAECIHIDAAEHMDPSIEKYPARFEIDLLECVFCGMCVEACPVDAIRMDSGIYSISDFTREGFVIDKEQLLAVEPQNPPQRN